MRCLISDRTDPCFNLATEEALLKESSEEFLLLSVNDQSVIIGKHQVALREINPEYVFTNSIPVVRRITGGGTVYHDNGNINFSFIRNSEPGRQVDFRKHTEPVINFLRSLGVDACFGGKNDIRVGNLKISGNAEHVFRNRVLHHGTLLFDASLEKLKNSLRSDFSGYSTKAVNSNPSEVMNLGGIISRFNDASGFIKSMAEYLALEGLIISSYDLTPSELSVIEALAKSKYRTWDWNYAYGPEYRFSNKFHVNGHECSCSLHVRAGIVEDCTFSGSSLPRELDRKITGRRHHPDDFMKVFEKEAIKITKGEFYRLF